MTDTTHARSRVLSTVLVVVFAAVTGFGVVLAGSRASAVFTEISETGTPGYLTLSRDTATPLWATLEPGQSMHWLIQASLHDASSGQLAIELRGSGELIETGGLTGGVDACAGHFDLTTLTCTGTLSSAVSPVALRDLPQAGGRVQLASIKQGEPRELLVTIALPSEAVIATDSTVDARIGLGVHAAGDVPTSVTPIPPKHTTPPVSPRLSVTGADLLPLGLLAAGLMGVGGALALRRRASR